MEHMLLAVRLLESVRAKSLLMSFGPNLQILINFNFSLDY